MHINSLDTAIQCFQFQTVKWLYRGHTLLMTVGFLYWFGSAWILLSYFSSQVWNGFLTPFRARKVSEHRVGIRKWREEGFWEQKKSIVVFWWASFIVIASIIGKASLSNINSNKLLFRQIYHISHFSFMYMVDSHHKMVGLGRSSSQRFHR